MYTDLLKIFSFVKDSVKDLSKLSSTAEKKKALLEILKTYFYLYDSYTDGVKLLNCVGNDPLNYIKSLSGDLAREQVQVWDRVLRRQAVRLYRTQEFISSESYLAVINPEAVENITKVIGYKMDRVVTLHGIGSSLFFRNILPIEETPEDIAELVLLVLAKQDSGLLDSAQVSKELEELKHSLDDFRLIIESVLEKDEILNLSKIARKETQL